MGMLRVMCDEGDRQYSWHDQASRIAAEKVFNELKARNYLAYEVKGDGSAEAIRSFKPEAGSIVMHTPLVGG